MRNTGKIERRRDRGKQRLAFIKSRLISNWIRIKGVEMIEATQDRLKWSVMTFLV